MKYKKEVTKFWMIERRRIYFLVLMTLLFSAASSPALALSIKAGVSVNYYSIADSLYKEIYGSGGMMYGLTLAVEPISRIEVRSEVNFYRSQGELTLTKEEIKFSLTPIVLGLRLRIVDISKVSPYVGFGVDFISYKEELPSRFEAVSESTTGFHFEGGVYLNLIKSFYIDANIRYLIANVEPFEEKVNLGGLRFGIGVGFQF